MKVAFIDIVHPILQKTLQKKGFECDNLETKSKTEIRNVIHKYDGIVIRSRIKLNVEFLALATQLKFIARSGAGMENIDLAFCAKHNITCFNSPEGNMQAVAEHGLGLLLMLFNHLKRGDAEVRQGIWRREENRGEELSAKTVGLVGYGNMGSAFAKVLSGIGCKVIAYDKYKIDFSNNYVKEVSLEELYEQTDVLSLHLPQTPETSPWLDASRITKFKNPFVLLNTARGKNVKLKDLVLALKSGTIKGTCLDVLEYEKSSFENLETDQLPEDWRYLINSENVLFSPHIAGWTNESYVKLSEYLAQKILDQFRAINP